MEALEEKPLHLNLILSLHKVLLDSVRGRNKAPGSFRRVQNFIGPPGCTQETATFVPPSVDRMTPSLDNWEKYLHSEERDVLVHLSVVKAQFELIHPFLDGNGRIGRMLIPVFLFTKGVLSSPMFYLSGYFERYRDEYYDALRGISEQGDWDGWIAYFLTAVEQQAEANLERTRGIVALHDRMKQVIPEGTRSQYAVQAIDALFDRPIFRIGDFVARSGIPRPTANRIVSVLRKQGIVEEVRKGSGSRAAILAFTELLEVTDL